MSDTSHREIVISQRFRAPRDLVFEAWTRSETLDRWMGPRGFVTTTQSFDFRVGGEWRYRMVHPEYGSFPNRARYLEILPSERLVYDLDAGVDGEGDVHRVTVTFVAEGERTLVTMRTVLASVEALEAAKGFGAVEMGGQTLAKLGEALEEAAEIDLVIVRELTLTPIGERTQLTLRGARSGPLPKSATSSPGCGPIWRAASAERSRSLRRGWRAVGGVMPCQTSAPRSHAGLSVHLWRAAPRWGRATCEKGRLFREGDASWGARALLRGVTRTNRWG